MKKNTFFKLVALFTFFCISTQSFSQEMGAGIGTLTPDASAALDVVNNNAGVLIPRISNVAINIPRPANGLLIYDIDKQCLSQNTGTPDAPNWVCISGNVVKFFYMPSISLDIVSAKPYDLYTLYKEQFAAPKHQSPGSPGSIPFFAAATDLYYYITDYNPAVFRTMDVSADGVLTYVLQDDAVAQAGPSEFVNIVLVVR